MFTSTFIPSILIQEYNFFLDETDSELNPMSNFRDQMNPPKRIYIQKKCDFKMINGILNGGTIQVDTENKVLRFLGYNPTGSTYPTKPIPFTSNWSKLIDLSDTFESPFLVKFPKVPNDKWYFFMRSEILHYLIYQKHYRITTIDINIISIEESDEICNITLSQLPELNYLVAF